METWVRVGEEEAIVVVGGGWWYTGGARPLWTGDGTGDERTRGWHEASTMESALINQAPKWETWERLPPVAGAVHWFFPRLFPRPPDGARARAISRELGMT